MTTRSTLRTVVLMLLGLAGCSGGGVDAEYGRLRDKSINGTGALAELFREQGSTVRRTTRLNEDVGEWSQTIVRFAPYPGPPDHKEAEWYRDWLSAGPDRRLIYIPRDYDAEPEYWTEVLANLPATKDASYRRRIETRRNESRSWPSELPTPAKEPAAAFDWFAIEPNAPAPSVCEILDGPWATDVDPAAALITKHQVPKVAPEKVFLSGDRVPLVFSWRANTGGEILVVANGSFLLNGSLMNRARRLLALRVVDWGSDPDDPANVAFVETRYPDQRGEMSTSSVFAPFTIDPTGWVLAHWMVFLLLLCLSAAAILGRPRRDPSAGSDRPVAHAEALGDLLERTRDVDAARDQIENYQRWRHPLDNLARRRGRG
jgi:hypothetical protein